MYVFTAGSLWRMKLNYEGTNVWPTLASPRVGGASRASLVADPGGSLGSNEFAEYYQLLGDLSPRPPTGIFPWTQMGDFQSPDSLTLTFPFPYLGSATVVATAYDSDHYTCNHGHTNAARPGFT